MSESLHSVVVIDDDYISLFLITKFLGEKQIAETILPFTNGIDALNYIAANAGDFLKLPDLILLDIKMPDINGWQFLHEINKIKFIAGYEPAICILSAETTIDFNIERNWPCVKGYLLKPILLNKLTAVIESLVTKVENNNMLKDIVEPSII